MPMAENQSLNVHQKALIPGSDMPSSKDIIQALHRLPHGGLSDVARSLGVTPQSVNSWKKGQKFPPWDRACHLVTVLKERGVLE